MQQKRIDDMSVAKSIYLRIASPTRLACNVREATYGCDSGRPYLMVRVGGSTHKDYVKIVLNRNNCYTLTHMRIFDIDTHVQVFAELEGIYPGQLSQMLSKIVRSH